MSEKTVLAFNVETQRLATEVEEEFADELVGASPWSRPDLFGFGCGVIVDLETDVAFRYRDAGAMLGHLREADTLVSYNGESFDLGVLSAYGEVEELRSKHTDINALVMVALAEHPLAQKPGIDRIRQGGLDGLSKANGFAGKSGNGIHAPTMLKAGRIEEVLDYCEQDVRLVAELYRIASRTGKLFVNGYTKIDGKRVDLGRLEVAIEIGGEA